MKRAVDARAGLARALGLALLLVLATGLPASADPPAPSRAAAASPRESVLGTRLLRGKLVGTTVLPIAEDRPADAPGRLAFTLLVAEDYTDFIGAPPGAVVCLQHDTPVDVATLDAASYGREVATRLPAHVRLGDEVLVVAETRRTTSPVRQRFRLVSVDPADAEATRAFLLDHARVVIALAEVHVTLPAYNPQQAIESAARLREDADATPDAMTAFHRRRQAWQQLKSARASVEAHERVTSIAVARLRALDAIALEESPEAATLRATLSDVRRRLDERQTKTAALIKTLTDLAGEEPVPPTAPAPKRTTSDATAGPVATIAGAALSMTAQAPSQAAATHLCRARLIGVQFTTEVRREPDLLPELSLDVLVLEDFNGSLQSLASAADAYHSLRWRDDVDLGTIDRETYDAALAALLPANTRLGDECLIRFTRTNTTKRLVDIRPWTPDGANAFLAHYAEITVPPLADAIERALERSFEVVPSVLRETANSRSQASRGRTLAGQLVDARALVTPLRHARRSLDEGRSRLAGAAARLTRIRDAADPEGHALADRTLALVPSLEGKALALDAQLVVAARLDPYLVPFILERTPEDSERRGIPAASPE